MKLIKNSKTETNLYFNWYWLEWLASDKIKKGKMASRPAEEVENENDIQDFLVTSFVFNKYR